MLCLTCKRVRPAGSKAEYTNERARLIIVHGLCVCAAPPVQPTDPRKTSAVMSQFA